MSQSNVSFMALLKVAKEEEKERQAQEIEDRKAKIQEDRMKLPTDNRTALIAKSKRAQTANLKLKNAYVTEAIQMALNQVLKNPSYLPQDPYKLFLQALRRYECNQAVPRLIAYTDMPPEGNIPESTDAYTVNKLAEFGDSKGLGLKHLAKLVSVSAINRIYSIVMVLREALGSLPRESKRGKIEATFMEAVAVNACLSENLCRPVSHRLEITVEGLVKNATDSKNQHTFNDCLMVFITRVWAEAFAASKANDIIADHMTITLGLGGRHVQRIPLKTMTSRRDQIVRILIAAIVDDGEVALDMYMLLRRNLPIFSEASSQYNEASLGYVHITKKYQFSYCDERGQMRCFSAYPMDSLARGVFMDPKDLRLYLEVYSQHHSRTVGAGGDEKEKSKQVGGARSSEDTLLSGIIYKLCSQIQRCFDSGEICEAGEWLLQLVALFTHASSGYSYSIRQVAALCCLQMGQIHYVREALTSLEGAMAIILDTIRGSADDEVKSEDAMTKLQLAYESISPAIMEFKGLLQQLFRDCSYSELQYLKPTILSTFYSVFDPLTQSTPICNPNVLKVSRIGVLGTAVVVEKTAKSLEECRYLLLTIEASLGADVLNCILEKDPLAVQIDSLGIDTINNTHPWNEAPRTLCECLGYVAVYGSGSRPTKSSINRLPWSGHRWSLPQIRIQSKVIDKTSTTLSHLDPQTEEKDIRGARNFWDLAAILTMSGAGRHGAVCCESSVADETARYEFPKFMTPEGAKMRYIVECHLMRGAQEGLYIAATSPTSALPVFAAVNQNLFKFSSYFQLHANLTDHVVRNRIFYPTQVKDCISAPSTLYGAAVLRVASGKGLGKTLGKAPITFLGGVIGPNRVISALSTNAFNVFRLAWMIPPIFPTAPGIQAGVQISCCWGIALETALHWGGCDALGGEGWNKNYSAAVEAAAASSGEKPLDRRPPSCGRVTSTPMMPGTFKYQDEEHNDAPPPLSTDPRDAEISPLNSPGPITLELALRAKYDQPSAEQRAKRAFTAAVIDALKFMSDGNDWKVDHVLCGTAEEIALLGPGALNYHTIPPGMRVFSATKVLQDDGLMAKLQQSLAKFGTAVFACAVALPVGSGQMSLAGIIKVFETLITKPIDGEGDPYADQAGSSESDPVYSDPTYNDLDRLCASGKASSEIQYVLRRSVRCYVPCLVRFSLLGMLTGLTIPKTDDPATISSLARRKTSDGPLSALIANDPGLSAGIGGVVIPRCQNHCSFGSDSTLSRLVASTIWFSQESCVSIWKGTSVGAVSCLEREAAARKGALRSLRSEHRYAEAHQQGLIFSLLSRRYDLTLVFARQVSSLAVKLWRVLQSVDMMTVLLQREDVVALDTHILGLTLAAQIALPLRRIITAPSCIHLCGGNVVLLRSLQELEQKLRIGMYPLALQEWPNALPDNYPNAPPSLMDSKASSFFSSMKGAGNGNAKPSTKAQTVSSSQSQSVVTIKSQGVKTETAADAELRRALNSSVEICQRAVELLRVVHGLGLGLVTVLGRDVDSWETLYGIDEPESSISHKWRSIVATKTMVVETAKNAMMGMFPEYAAKDSTQWRASKSKHSDKSELLEESDQDILRPKEMSTEDAGHLLFPSMAAKEAEKKRVRLHPKRHSEWLLREGLGSTYERVIAYRKQERAKIAAQEAELGMTHSKTVMSHMLGEIKAVHRFNLAAGGQHLHFGLKSVGEAGTEMGVDGTGSGSAENTQTAAADNAKGGADARRGEMSPGLDATSGSKGRSLWGALKKSANLGKGADSSEQAAHMDATLASIDDVGGLGEDGIEADDVEGEDEKEGEGGEELLPTPSPRRDQSGLFGLSQEEEERLKLGLFRPLVGKEREEMRLLVKSLTKVDSQIAAMRETGTTLLRDPASVKEKFVFASTMDMGSPSRLGFSAADSPSVAQRYEEFEGQGLDYSQSFSASGFALPAKYQRSGPGMAMGSTMGNTGTSMLSMLRAVASGNGEAGSRGKTTRRARGIDETDDGMVIGDGLEDIDGPNPFLGAFRARANDVMGRSTGELDS